MFEGFETGRMAVDGVEIAFVAGGDGPPVVLLHGYPQTKAMWAQVAPVLAQRYRVVVADLRGYGDSAKPDPEATENYSFRAMAADQLGLMRALGHDRFHIIGHDRGGRTAHRLALDTPDAVVSITVMDIIPTHSVFAQTDQALAAAYWHWFFLPQPNAARLIANDPDDYFESALFGWGGAGPDSFDAAQLADYRRCWRDPAMIAATCADYRAALHIDQHLDAEDLGRSLAIPCHVVYGAKGVMGRMFDVPRTWADRFDTVTGTAIEAGHFLIDEQPDAVAQACLAFLDAN